MSGMTMPVSDACSDPGKVRRNNEDRMLRDESERGCLYAVADGMGGHVAGERASALACEAVERVWRAAEGLRDDEVEGLLKRMVFEADGAIVAEARRDLAYYGMGTTLTLGLVRAGRLHIAHVGDSRVYRLRDGVLAQLTEDHTALQKLVAAGRMTKEEAARSPYRNRLSQAVGVGMRLQVFSRQERLQAGDRLLLCSDGLYDMVAEAQIEAILAAAPAPSGACRALVEAANEAGGEDNVSVIVVDIPEGMGDGCA